MCAIVRKRCGEGLAAEVECGNSETDGMSLPNAPSRAIAHGNGDAEHGGDRPCLDPLRLREAIALMTAMAALSVYLIVSSALVQPVDQTRHLLSTFIPELLPAKRPRAPGKEFTFLAFYYPWYVGGDWSRHETQGHTPLLGPYGSDQIEMAERHVEMAVRGGIDAWAVSWRSKDAPAAANFANAMLNAKNIHKIKFTMVYESIGALPVDGDFGNGTSALDKFGEDMIYFRDTYFSHPSYLHVNGRPVVYVYLARYWKNFEPYMLDVIKERVGRDVFIVADGPYYHHNAHPETAVNGLGEDGAPVFEAYTSYNMYSHPLVGDGESAADYMFREALPVYERWSNRTVFFPHVLPKYHDFREGHRPLTGDAAGLRAQLEAFACLSRPSWYEEGALPNLVFVTSFNEWWEGTSIEPDAEGEYGYEFLNEIRSFKDTGVQCDENKLLPGLNSTSGYSELIRMLE